MNPRAKGNARPILGKRAVRGLERMLEVLPAYTMLDDADMQAGMSYIRDFLTWHRKPETVAKRIARGAAIKNWKPAP